MFKKVVLPTIAVSAMIFAGFSTLLAQYGSERIEVRVNSQDIIYGEVRDFVSPGMGAVLSLTLGLASIAIIGYSESASKLEKLEKQLLSVQEAISDKDVRIEELRKEEKINNVEFVDFSRR
ncbi:MAG: hypothetical protein AAF757_16070 [Cyanobacteria bacterium P01_D01_bin.116]